ncbi:MAG: hypothetical protein ABIK07_14565 [Planctomycetota bacterium]
MSDHKTSIGKRISLAFGILLYASVGAAVLIPLLFISWFMLTGFSSEPQRRAVMDPGADFTFYTGLEWPASAVVISSGDIHLDFLGDGEFHLVFDVDQATLEHWLAEAPPWEQREWKHGPVLDEIGWHCGFGASGMSADPAGGGPDKKINEIELEHVLGSKQIWYVARDRAPQWEHGDILIVDPEHNRVWYSRWDL